MRSDPAGLLAMPKLYGSEFRGGSVMSSPVVLITGALTGIGRAAAVIFAQEGAHVVVVAINQDKS